MAARQLPKRPTRRFVLDASVACSWFFKDETNRYAESILDVLGEVTIVVPPLWHYEIANTLLVGERRGRSTSSQAAEFYGLLNRFSIETDRISVHNAWDRTTMIGREYSLSSYDASYLEIATREQLSLASLDQRLNAAAVKEKVTLFLP